MRYLIVTQDHCEPEKLELFGESRTIGRSSMCDITIRDRYLQRRHARLYRVEDEWFIEDLGTRNGTFVNGRRIEGPEPVNPGDVIALSAVLIKLVDDSVADSAPADEVAVFELSEDVDFRMCNPGEPKDWVADAAAHSFDPEERLAEAAVFAKYNGARL